MSGVSRPAGNGLVATDRAWTHNDPEPLYCDAPGHGFRESQRCSARTDWTRNDRFPRRTAVRFPSHSLGSDRTCLAARRVLSVGCVPLGSSS